MMRLQYTFIIMVTLVVACGQKGPLKLPEKSAQPTPAAKVTPAPEQSPGTVN